MMGIALRNGAFINVEQAVRTFGNILANPRQLFEPLFPRLRSGGSLQFVAYDGGQHGRNEERRVEARVRRDGSREAAGNRQ